MTINEIKGCRVAGYHTIMMSKKTSVSSKEQLEHQYRTVADQHSWTVSRFYFDEGNDHAGLDQLIADCKSGEIDLVLCLSIDCFGRNVRELLRVTKVLSEIEKPVGIWFEEPRVFTLDHTGNLVLIILAAAAEEECRQKSLVRKQRTYTRKKDVRHE